MPREDGRLSAAKQSYKSASAVGNRQEEARWANVIGDIYKNRAEYVEALKWLRIDYEVSTKHLPEKHLLTTCQSLGEVYLRLADYKHALIYQKKHLELAKDSGDLVEQQRAYTQLGRTYHEIFSKSEDDHSSVRNAKKYFRKAMELAKALKENPLPHVGSYIKEYIDAHNNIGMLEMDLDNLEESRKMLTRGLQICDEEEVPDNDDARSRLHHNLGYVYTELRKWDKAREHIEKDIIICQKIGHYQGEAKGYINLGELHYRCQKYEDAISCYQRAHTLANSLEDENALNLQIDQNIDTVNAAMKVMDELKKEEQILKKLIRNLVMERGTSTERKCLIKQNECLDRLLEKSSTILAWKKHHEFAKQKKTVSEELCDKEKMADSYMLIGESYQKLRFFDKSLKWYLKSWEVYRSVRNLEGQALVKINIGNVLDSVGDSTGALKAYEDGYRIAVEASLPSVQLSALENMHYIQMIRLDNIDEARECQHAISKLKQLELKDQNGTTDICSETDTEGDNHALHVECEGNLSTRSNRSNTSGSQANLEPLDEDETLISIFHSARKSSRINVTHVENRCTSPKAAEALSVSLSKSSSSQQTTVGRKRVRVVLSDDEDEVHEESHKKLAEDIATSDEVRSVPVPDGPACTMKDVSGAASNCAMSSYTPGSLEENTSGCKFRSPMIGQHGKSLKSSSIELAEKRVVARESGRSDREEHIMCKIGDDIVQLEVRSVLTSNYLSTDSLKVEVACLYYLQLPVEKKSRGLLPIIRTLECDGRPLESLKMSSNSEDMVIRNCIEAFVEGWVHKPLMTLYVDNCKDLSEAPNIKLLKRLYDLEVSEDEVIATDCDLQDMSIKPLLKALHTLKTVSMIDLSHNMLGNGTMEALRQIFLSSGQAYGSLSMDLHCNRFGATALFQICECPVLFDRLEMLNLSGNRLTDACGSYLSTILEKCKALYSLNIERCSVTSRTIQKIADSLNSGSSLTHLSIGENSPISANVTAHLLEKLETLKRFSELSLKGIKLSKSVIDRLCRLIEVVCLSGLMLGSTNTGSDGALKLIEKLSSGTQELVKLDLSYCNLSSECIVQLNKNAELIGGIAELNLGGNAITLEGKNALTCLLMNPVCALKVLVLNNCQLGLTGLIKIIQTLEVNSSLEELSLAHNVDLQSQKANAFDMTYKDMTAIPSTDNFDDETKDNQHKEIDGIPQCSNAANVDYNDLEVADSEDESIRDKPPVSKVTLKCSSSSQSNRSSVNLNYIQELSSAISKAKNLKFLDLSNNGFSNQDVELLYSTWSGTRAGPSLKHVNRAPPSRSRAPSCVTDGLLSSGRVQDKNRPDAVLLLGFSSGAQIRSLTSAQIRGWCSDSAQISSVALSLSVQIRFWFRSDRQCSDAVLRSLHFWEVSKSREMGGVRRDPVGIRFFREELFSVFVDNIPKENDGAWLRRLFNQEGKTRDVFIPTRERRGSRSRFGFVRFQTLEEAKAAVRRWNGTPAGRGVLVVMLADKDGKAAVQSVEKGGWSSKADGPRGEAISKLWRPMRMAEELALNDPLKHQPRRRRIALNSIQSTVDWLRCCLVADLRSIVPVSQLQEELENSELKFNKVFSMGGKRMLVHFNSLEDLEVCLSKKCPIFRRRFSNIQKWEDEEDQPKSRSVWLSISGLPFKTWGEENFKKIAEPLGTFLKMEDRDFRMCGVGRARMLVETDSFERVADLLEVVLDGKVFEVAVCEDCFFNGAETDWCQEEFADVVKDVCSGASKKSSEGGEVDSKKSLREEFESGQAKDGPWCVRWEAVDEVHFKIRSSKEVVAVENDDVLARVGEVRCEGLCSEQRSEFAVTVDSEVPAKAAESSLNFQSVTSDDGAEYDMTLAEFESNRKLLNFQRRKESNLKKSSKYSRRQKKIQKKRRLEVKRLEEFGENTEEVKQATKSSKSGSEEEDIKLREKREEAILTYQQLDRKRSISKVVVSVDILSSRSKVKGKVLRKEGDGKRIFSELAMTKMGGSSSSEASSGRHREEVEEPCRKSLAADVRGHDGMPLEVEKLQTEIIKTLCGVEQNKKTHCMCGVEQSNGIEGMEFQSLADLVRTHRPRVIGLIETKMASRSIYSRSHIDCVVEGVNQFRPSIFYGNQATHKRIESWELLKKLKSQTDLPWLASPGRFERGVVQLGIGAERRQGDLEAKARLDRAFKWLKEGDVNAKFFHERASQRNTVEKLKGEDGIWIKVNEMVSDIFFPDRGLRQVDYYYNTLNCSSVSSTTVGNRYPIVAGIKLEVSGGVSSSHPAMTELCFEESKKKIRKGNAEEKKQRKLAGGYENPEGLVADL
ncbi:unnamed protein product [Rhodiola kirilowii]